MIMIDCKPARNGSYLSQNYLGKNLLVAICRLSSGCIMIGVVAVAFIRLNNHDSLLKKGFFLNLQPAFNWAFNEKNV
jgi:hypothetical protein